MPRQLHLLGFPEHLEGVHHALREDLKDGPVSGYSGSPSIRYWQHVASTLERGCFDGIFFADTGAIYDRYKGRPDEAIKYGVGWPRHDPMPMLVPMSMASEHLGFAVTLSIAAMQPYPAVRLLSTLDFLTDGRLGWNIVTGNARMEYEAIGLEEVDHDTRYDRADEYLEICHALWNGFPPDALIMDAATGIIADPSRIARIDYQGRFLKSRAVPLIAPSPQGHPVLFQAGSSGRGQSFALATADVIFSIQPDGPSMKAYVDTLNTQSAVVGRTDPVRVIFGLQIVLGSTAAEARQRREDLLNRFSLEASLTRLSGSLGIDFSTIDLDSPMQEWPTQASRGLVKALSGMVDGRRLTLRDVASSWATSVGTPHIVGTPDEVADQIADLWASTGCHGFNLRPTTIPDSFDEFVDTVVPRLQAKGIFRKSYEGRTFRDNVLSP